MTTPGIMVIEYAAALMIQNPRSLNFPQTKQHVVLSSRSGQNYRLRSKKFLDFGESDGFTLRYGTKQEVKNILKTMDETLLKTLLNVMLNALENSDYSVNMTQKYKSKLKPYIKTYKKLLDKKIPLKKKYPMLQKAGHEYIPTFLKILVDDVYDCIPTGKGKRIPLDCPLCNKKGLVRLANHLTQKHSIKALLYSLGLPIGTTWFAFSMEGQEKYIFSCDN